MSETEQNQETNADIKIKSLNRWLAILVIFMVLYSAAMLVLIDNKTERAIQMAHPVVIIDPATMQINSTAYTNLIHPIAMRTNPAVVDIATNAIAEKAEAPKPMFEQKENYEVGDFVVVNFFYVETIIVEKLPKDYYRLMYKDHNHSLQVLTLHKQFLLAPTSYNVVSPVSLLVD